MQNKGVMILFSLGKSAADWTPQPISLLANTGTEDGRITKGKTYLGTFVWKKRSTKNPGWRFWVRDNSGELMSFDPQVFDPVL